MATHGQYLAGDRQAAVVGRQEEVLHLRQKRKVNDVSSASVAHKNCMTKRRCNRLCQENEPADKDNLAALGLFSILSRVRGVPEFSNNVRQAQATSLAAVKLWAANGLQRLS